MSVLFITDSDDEYESIDVDFVIGSKVTFTEGTLAFDEHSQCLQYTNIADGIIQMYPLCNVMAISIFE